MGFLRIEKILLYVFFGNGNGLFSVFILLSKFQINNILIKIETTSKIKKIYLIKKISAPFYIALRSHEKTNKPVQIIKFKKIIHSLYHWRASNFFFAYHRFLSYTSSMSKSLLYLFLDVFFGELSTVVNLPPPLISLFQFQFRL